jgi:hypothetical protein
MLFTRDSSVGMASGTKVSFGIAFMVVCCVTIAFIIFSFLIILMMSFRLRFPDNYCGEIGIPNKQGIGYPAMGYLYLPK